MTDMVSFNVTYDRLTDVLYINTERVPAESGVTDDYGIVWRYDAEGKLIGATVIDFADYWNAHTQVLERELSLKFGVPVNQMKVVLAKVQQ